MLSVPTPSERPTALIPLSSRPSVAYAHAMAIAAETLDTHGSNCLESLHESLHAALICIRGHLTQGEAEIVFGKCTCAQRFIH